ncbi:MAG: hypothetical protein CFH40_02611, partial [Alphaproteobacteria bacterium MarineAlpha10_Bin3]
MEFALTEEQRLITGIRLNKL